MKAPEPREFVILLQNIRSLHNVGSIFRTADATGVSKIYLCGITPAPLDRFGHPEPKLIKVSLGAERYIPWEKVRSAAKTIEALRKEGFTVLAVEQSKKSVTYNKFGAEGNKKIALILGNEVRGLPSSILKKCDKILEIPMRGKKESLNVSVAFGIVAFEIASRLYKI
jgi:23S rRNA (guanosine2251-2'-O)-methyltransferase